MTSTPDAARYDEGAEDGSAPETRCYRRHEDDDIREIESIWDTVAVDPEVQSSSRIVPPVVSGSATSRRQQRCLFDADPAGAAAVAAAAAFDDSFDLETGVRSRGLDASGVSAAQSTFLQAWRVNANLLLTILLCRRHRDDDARRFLLNAQCGRLADKFEWISFRQEPVLDCLDL
jgi:hypothetical protein